MTASTQASGANKPQGFPVLDSVLANPDGTATRPWLALFRQLWLRTGGSANAVVSAAISGLLWIIQSGTNFLSLVGGTENETGTATIVTTPVTGSPAEVLIPGPSPWTFVPSFQGTLLVFGARVDMSRDAGATFFPVTLTGGAVPLLLGDTAKLTWYVAGTPPTVTFLPGGA